MKAFLVYSKKGTRPVSLFEIRDLISFDVYKEVLILLH